MGNKKKKGDKKDDDHDDDFMQTIIEIDETYLGGKAENKHMSERIERYPFFKQTLLF
jgi:hypothetical protein